MRDAFGGLMNVILVALFLVIVSGILGLIVNYNKAFRMKNIVISYIENYQASEGCFSSANSTCRTRIEEAAKSIGYSPTELNCENYQKFSSNGKGLFCWEKRHSDSGKYDIYTVVTQVDINIPIINKIMGLSFFQVSGDTRVINRG